MGSATRTTQNLISLAALILCSIIMINPVFCSSSDQRQSRTAYEILKDYDFPVGLLPQGVTGYDLNITTGKFVVYFDHTCSFSLQRSYHLKYKPIIRGYVSNGKLSRLEGIYARLFLVWKEIVEIVRNGDELVFSVGPLSSVSPIHHFDQSPQCGCGFNCVMAIN